MKMRIVITGATGFIGRALCERLGGQYEIVGLSRNAERAAESLGALARVVEWDGRNAGTWVDEVEGSAAVVNLAGENVASGRWSASKKSRILRSRTDSTRALVRAIERAESKPEVMIQASAIGYYGRRGDESVDEASSTGSGFLAGVCRESEGVGREVEAVGVRYVVIRTGIVLGLGTGALVKLMAPFRFYLGGYPGSGRQWLSWITLDDEIGAIEYLIRNGHLRGVFNLTSPRPVTMRQFSKTLGRVLRRPAWIAVPGFVVRLLVGQMADELLLGGQRVLPGRLVEAGFNFKYEVLEQALTAIMKGESK